MLIFSAEQSWAELSENLLIKSVDRSSKSNSSLLEKLAVASVVEHLIDLSSVVSSCVEVELEKLLDQESVAVSSGASGDLSLGAGDFSVQFGNWKFWNLESRKRIKKKINNNNQKIYFIFLYFFLCLPEAAWERAIRAAENFIFLIFKKKFLR